MNIPDLFVVLVGYWPHSAPDIDDPVAVAAHQDILGDFRPELVHEAVRRIANEGREFCPPPGVIAAATRAATPPTFYKPELPPADDGDLDVPALLAEARRKLHDRSPDLDSGWDVGVGQ